MGIDFAIVLSLNFLSPLSTMMNASEAANVTEAGNASEPAGEPVTGETGKASESVGDGALTGAGQGGAGRAGKAGG